MLNTFGTLASLKTLDFCAFLDVVITLHVAGVHQDLYIYILMSSLHVYRPRHSTKNGKCSQSSNLFLFNFPYLFQFQFFSADPHPFPLFLIFFMEEVAFCFSSQLHSVLLVDFINIGNFTRLTLILISDSLQNSSSSQGQPWIIERGVQNFKCITLHCVSVLQKKSEKAHDKYYQYHCYL